MRGYTFGSVGLVDLCAWISSGACIMVCKGMYVYVVGLYEGLCVCEYSAEYCDRFVWSCVCSAVLMCVCI